MLKHVQDNPIQPKRVVILGAKGFVGTATVDRLAKANIPTLAIGREDIDLCEKKAGLVLADALRADDAVVVISAKAPCKNHGMMLENIQIMNSVCDAFAKQPVSHVIYISSDAVYTDSMDKLNESSPTAPTSLHGAMHLAREQMLRSVVRQDALAILRPSLLYGAHDPHNGYGPNSFYRLARANQPIKLFGQGEERRDHVYIEDVAELIYLCLLKRSYGVLNLTTGNVVSFYDVASLLQQVTSNQVEILCSPRHGQMPHNGYRAFDNTVCQDAFSEFKYTSLMDGLEKMYRAELKCSEGDASARS